MDHQACLDYLNSHGARNVPGGFARTMRMAELLGNPQENLRIIHIAGTNGKGSTAAMIASILQQAGYRVGLFTSPHLERYEERIQINRQLIPEEQFAALLTQLIEQIIPKLLDEQMEHPGVFELLTVASWMYFQAQTDFVISEVGLGGTLDPTNIITKPVLTVITPVSLDHCEILGQTIAAIAREKAGILKAGVPAIIAPQQLEGLQAIQAVAEQLQVPVTVVSMESKDWIETSLQGIYQQMNCRTALAAVQNLQQRGVIQVSEAQIAAGLRQVSWPGRMEYLSLGQNRAILLDGAHNPAGIECLAENLRLLYADRELILFLSILDDKEQYTMLSEILPLASAVVLTKPEHDQRAKNWKQLEQLIRTLRPDCQCRVYEEYRQGLQQEVAMLQPGQMLCITGSLYLLGDCRRLLHSQL